MRLADGTEVDVELDGDFAVVHTSTDDPDDELDDDSDDDSDDGSDGDNVPVGDAERQRATDAALAETGEGTVTDVEVDDGGYDVEVRLADGTEIDVDLDADFAVVRTESGRLTRSTLTRWRVEACRALEIGENGCSEEVGQWTTSDTRRSEGSSRRCKPRNPTSRRSCRCTPRTRSS